MSRLEKILQELLTQGKLDAGEAAAILGCCWDMETERKDSNGESFATRYGTFAVESLLRLNKESTDASST